MLEILKAEYEKVQNLYMQALEIDNLPGIERYEAILAFLKQRILELVED